MDEKPHDSAGLTAAAPPRPIAGVALDLDGLLYDTEPLYFRVGTEVLARRQKTFDMALQKKMMGRPGLEAIAQMVRHHDLPDDPQTLLEESEAIYAGLLRSELQPMPGLETLVAVLEAAAFPFGVATSSRRHFAEQILRRDALLDRLAFLLTGDDVQRGKPHPEMYRKAADRLEITASSMLVLEDSENGCAAAVAAGAIAVAVTGEHVGGHTFPGAALQVRRLDDPRLLAWLSSEPG
jgi:HAD superfamily hydrolase (TIGR01509 family)